MPCAFAVMPENTTFLSEPAIPVRLFKQTKIGVITPLMEILEKWRFSIVPPSTASMAMPDKPVSVPGSISLYSLDQSHTLLSLGLWITQLEIVTLRKPQCEEVPNLIGLQLDAMIQFVTVMFSGIKSRSSLFKQMPSSSESMRQLEIITLRASTSMPSLFTIEWL